MEQNQSIIGKECIIGQNFPQLPTTKEWNGIDVKSTFGKLKDLFAEAGLPVIGARYNIDKNTIDIECGTKAYAPMKGLILDIQGAIAVIALKDVHKDCNFDEAVRDAPRDAYIPMMWEMVKYINYLQKYWPISSIYWSSQSYRQPSGYSYLYRLYLRSGDCYAGDRYVGASSSLSAGYFIKMPTEHLKIIKQRT